MNRRQFAKLTGLVFCGGCVRPRRPEHGEWIPRPGHGEQIPRQGWVEPTKAELKKMCNTIGPRQEYPLGTRSGTVYCRLKNGSTIALHYNNEGAVLHKETYPAGVIKWEAPCQT